MRVNSNGNEYKKLKDKVCGKRQKLYPSLKVVIEGDG